MRNENLAPGIGGKSNSWSYGGGGDGNGYKWHQGYFPVYGKKPKEGEIIKETIDTRTGSLSLLIIGETWERHLRMISSSKKDYALLFVFITQVRCFSLFKNKNN
jgi:hypothetical protein